MNDKKLEYIFNTIKKHEEKRAKNKKMFEIALKIAIPFAYLAGGILSILTATTLIRSITNPEIMLSTGAIIFIIFGLYLFNMERDC